MITENLDVAQIILYAFWIFFFGLIFWLRREDRREGYPLETDTPRRIYRPDNGLMIPKPKKFQLPEGGTVEAPNFARDNREIKATRVSNAAGSPLQPNGEPLLSGVGPASFAQRSDHPEMTREGHPLIVPMRVASDFSVIAGPDPRGWEVVAGDGKVAGVVKDLWVDRADSMVRYLEVTLTAEGGQRLLPITMLRLRPTKRVEVVSILAKHFPLVPTTKNTDRVTVLEEEKISAFYAGGRLYAEPNRLGPVL